MNARLYEQPNKVEINYRERTIKRGKLTFIFQSRLVSSTSRCKMSSTNNQPSKKRKRTCLTICEKLEICKLVQPNTPYKQIVTKYGISKSAITGIVSIQSKLRDTQSDYHGFLSSPKHKTSNYPELDTSSFLWIRQMREKNVPVNGPMLSEKII